MKNLIFIFLAFLLPCFSYGSQEITAEGVPYILTEEFNRLRSFVAQLKPDGDVGGYYWKKDYGDHLLLWKLEESEDARAYHEVIRLYASRGEDQKPFAVTYHKTTGIIDGLMVLRRFIGPEPTGWRNDTIDYQTGEYLGSQGFRRLWLQDEDLRILKRWNITPFSF